VPDRIVASKAPRRGTDRLLDAVERLGNRLPDPAVLFVILLFVVWILSKLLAPVQFAEINPRTQDPIRVVDQLTGKSLTSFLSNMVATFTGFHPLGVVLVALLGVGVAERSGYINAVLKSLLQITPPQLLTPMIVLVGILSHTAADAGYVLVIPLGGVIFFTAGRHPLAGIAAAFAGVSGGFSANFMLAGIDPLLQGLTQAGAQILDPTCTVNPACNWFFTASSSLLIIGLGWLVTALIVEPRLRALAVDGDQAAMAKMEAITPAERRGMRAANATLLASLLLLVLACLPATSPFRNAQGKLTLSDAPLMQGIVPLIFLLFLLPGLAHGYGSHTFRNTRDVIKGMSETMSTMGYYLVMAFFASLFIKAFGDSQLGALLALKGAAFLKAVGLPGPATIVGIILLTAFINLFVGSASAKWALLAPIFVPMLMQLGLSPELTQAAYRVGDSTTNIITPLMPYFPLVVVFCQRYVKSTGIGTLTSIMLPYSVTFLLGWTAFLLAYWSLGLPLGLEAVYTYPGGR
jgi:aminobenzoyl-glutamate transport protein